MPKLSRRATRQAFEFLRDLYALRSWDDLTTHVVNTLPTLIATDMCSYNDMSSCRRYAAYRAWPDKHPMIPDDQEILGRYIHQHPIATHIERTKDLSTRKITDFVSQREFRKTALYNEFYRPLQLPYTMGTGIALTQDSVIAIGLHRSKQDFGEQDLAMLELLRPHLVQAYGNAHSVSAMQEQLAALNRSMEEMDRAMMSITPHGRIHWATARASQLLADYGLQGKRQSDLLPSPLREWLSQQHAAMTAQTDLPAPLTPLIIEHAGRSLTIRFVQDGPQRLLFLEEHGKELSPTSLNQLGLSRRETEILGWIVKGKSNPEIAMILSISVRTIHKHVEHIYLKLGVENRHAAISLAFEAMRGLRG